MQLPCVKEVGSDIIISFTSRYYLTKEALFNSVIPAEKMIYAHQRMKLEIDHKFEEKFKLLNEIAKIKE